MTPSTVLFCGLPAFGHLYPMIPLALAARAAGHRVVFATGAPFVGRLRAIGFETEQVGISVQDGVTAQFGGRPAPRRPDGRPDEESGAALFLDVLARPMATDVLPLLDRHRPDLVVYEETAIGGRVAAAVRDVPAISHRIVAAASTQVAGSPAGREMIARLFRHVGAAPGGISGDGVLDVFPNSLGSGAAATHPITIPVRPVPWSEPGGSIPEWLAGARRPVVYLTLGTVFAEPGTFRAAIEAVASLDVEVLVALGPVDPADVGPVPSTVHLERFVDQPAVLPSVDVVVHHGGSGTMLGAAAYGRPQLVLPLGADQFYNGETVTAAGVGLMLQPAHVGAGEMAGAVHRLLTESSFRAAAAAVRREIAAMPHPREVLPTIMDVVSRAA